MLFALFLAPLWAWVPASAAGSAETLIAEAGVKRLHENLHWLRLLHYRKHGDGVVSDIDGGYFFLSPRGKTDSRAEMEATLRALLSKEDLSPPLEKGLEPAAMHPLCKFRARLRFLQAHLAFPDSLLPETDCGRFERWRAALNPKGVTLVFASSYLNNPASMFGHTFLRLDNHAGDGDRAILNYGVGYGALVPPGEGAAFVFKGVTGKYRAAYSIAPYFVSLQKYSHLESRDIWEYDLALDSLQREYLLEHVWEVGACWMDYYFFDENCSYNIVSLLDAVSPGLGLVESLDGAVVIPAETVKLLLTRKGMVRSVQWRPSLLSAFRLRAARLGPRERRYLRALALAEETPASPFGPDTTASLMDAALDYVQYRKRRSKAEGGGPWGVRQGRLLRVRATLPASPSVYPVGRDREITPPETGHDAHQARVSLGASQYRAFIEVGYRLAYHDFNAGEEGFLAGSQIEALRLRLRYYCGEACGRGPRGFEVRSFDVLNILSISPMDFIQHPLSWGVRLGFETRAPGAVLPGAAVLAEGGAGAAAAWRGPLDFRTYLLAQGRLRARLQDGGRPSLGPQVRGGMRLAVPGILSIWLESRNSFPLLGRRTPESDLVLEFRQSLGRNLDLRLSALAQDGVGEVAAAWNFYF